MRRPGGEAIALPTDVADEGAVHELAQRPIERFGYVDAWVNNAGVYLIGDFESTPPDAFRRVYDVNLFGVVHGCRAILPHFRERRSGVIVNIASVDSYLGTREHATLPPLGELRGAEAESAQSDV
jgi:NAD(P)-dependent dehydrogenase (short-subunit alcohol dehydrogenase family)